MVSSESSAQQVDSCSSGTDTGTKRIVYLTRVPLPASNPPRCWQEAGPRLLKKSQLKENIASYCHLDRVVQLFGRLSLIMRSSRNCKESIGRDHLSEEPVYVQVKRTSRLPSMFDSDAWKPIFAS